MRVKVVMDLPENCSRCAFCEPGKDYYRCYFPGKEHGLPEVSKTRPNSCPLNNCEPVIEEEERPSRVKFSELPVGSIFRLGKLYLMKISNDAILNCHEDLPNAINFLNGHRIVLVTSLFVQPLSISDVPKRGEKMTFAELKKGDVFRRGTTFGIKRSDNWVPDNWAIIPASQRGEIFPNFEDLITGRPRTISSDTAILRLPW